jgi:hypothetical protein
MSTFADSLRETAIKAHKLELETNELNNKKYAQDIMIDWKENVMRRAENGEFSYRIRILERSSDYQKLGRVYINIIKEEVMNILNGTGVTARYDQITGDLILSWEC